jgi:hypothetical protein
MPARRYRWTISCRRLISSFMHQVSQPLLMVVFD